MSTKLPLQNLLPRRGRALSSQGRDRGQRAWAQSLVHRCWCHTQGALVSVFTNTSDLTLATQQHGRHCPCPAKMAEGRWTRSCTKMYIVQDEQKKFLWTIQKRKLQVWKLTRICLLGSLVSTCDAGPHTYRPSQTPTYPTDAPVWASVRGHAPPVNGHFPSSVHLRHVRENFLSM